MAEVASSHGLRLTYHNHDTEMTEVDGTLVIDRLAAGLGDAVDFQVDIFWVVVGGAEPASVIGRLGERVVSLHVKDGIDLPRSAYADEPFVNVPVGTGVVDPAPRHRRRGGPRIGRMAHRRVRPRRGVRHHGDAAEPREPDGSRARPRPQHVIAENRPTRVGIVGCGDVTNLYLPGTAPFTSIELAACTDLDADRAAALSARGGFPAVSLDELLADPTIDIVLVLTPPVAHADVSRAAIAAGKHIYTEKPLARHARMRRRSSPRRRRRASASGRRRTRSSAAASRRLAP